MVDVVVSNQEEVEVPTGATTYQTSPTACVHEFRPSNSFRRREDTYGTLQNSHLVRPSAGGRLASCNGSLMTNPITKAVLLDFGRTLFSYASAAGGRLEGGWSGESCSPRH